MNIEMEKGANSGVTIATLGGVEQIGRHCTLINSGRDMLMVDCGLSFSKERFLGLVKEVPAVRLFERSLKDLKGIVITHGHEDHIGGLAWVLSEMKQLYGGYPTVYAPRIALEIVTKRCIEAGLTKFEKKLIPIEAGENFKVGKFRVNAFSVAHSMPQSLAFGIEINGYKIFCTGDFKMEEDPARGLTTDITGISQFCMNGVDVLMSDSTNAMKPGFAKKESDVAEEFDSLFARTEGRIFVTMFASHLRRLFTLLELAAKYKRKVVILGSSLEKGFEMATEVGIGQSGKDVIIPVEKIDKYHPNQLLFLCTGCQGEYGTAMEKIANGRHQNNIHVGNGDTVVFSSSVIPGNDHSVGAIVNKMMKSGARVLDKGYHASGHGYQEDLTMMIKLVKPKHFMPVHGEFRHLHAHAGLAVAAGVENIHLMENGSIWYLDNNGSYTLQRDIKLGDFTSLDESGDMVGKKEVAERRRIAQRGVLFINVVVPRNRRPEFGMETRGKRLSFKDINAILLDRFPDVLHQTEMLGEDVKDVLTSYFREKKIRLPEIIVSVVLVR